MPQFCLFISLLLSANSFAQSTFLYHSFKETASNFKITQWNISPDSLPALFLKETIDSHGRVIELDYFKNGTTDFQTVCYLFTVVQFQYPNDTTIIQFNLNGAGEKSDGLECATPSKTVYHLSADKITIKKADPEFFIDTTYWLNNGLTLEGLKIQIKELKNNESIGDYVKGYEDSFAKLTGIFPVAAEFNFKDIFFMPLEKKEIENALNKK